MRKSVLAAGLWIVTFAVPVLADQMLVFKKDSSYGGAAMRVASYEEKDGRLLIRTLSGEVVSARADGVDWAATRTMSERLEREEQEEAIQREAAAAARRSAEEAAKRSREKLTLVSASRRYGVERPGMSVASGSAASAAPELAPVKPAAAAAPAPAGGKDPAAARAAREKLAAAKAERDRLAKEVQALQSDTNPDPLSASLRESRLKEKQAQLARIERSLAALQAEVEKAGGEAPPDAGEKPPPKPSGSGKSGGS